MCSPDAYTESHSSSGLSEEAVKRLEEKMNSFSYKIEEAGQESDNTQMTVTFMSRKKPIQK